MNEQLKQALKAVKAVASKPEFDEATVERLIRESLEKLPQLVVDHEDYRELLIVPYKNKEAEEAARRLMIMFQEGDIGCRLVDRPGRGNYKSLHIDVRSAVAAAKKFT